MRYTTAIIVDRSFWTRLEFMACGWLYRCPEKELRRFWIDGFVPETFHRTNPAAVVEGMVWVAQHNGGQTQYRFRASLPWGIVNRSREEFEIHEFVLDPERRTVELNLSRREDDRSSATRRTAKPGKVAPGLTSRVD